MIIELFMDLLIYLSILNRITLNLTNVQLKLLALADSTTTFDRSASTNLFKGNQGKWCEIPFPVSRVYRGVVFPKPHNCIHADMHCHICGGQSATVICMAIYDDVMVCHDCDSYEPLGSQLSPVESEVECSRSSAA